MRIKVFFLITILFVIASCNSTKKIDATSRDGSSFRNAVIVNSISEEYEFTQLVCKDCEFVMQALLFNKKNPYDLLEYKKTTGETVEYYFDISSFY
jgi:uncharacterized protein YcfL